MEAYGTKVVVTEEMFQVVFRQINRTRYVAHLEDRCGQPNFRKCKGDCGMCPYQKQGVRRVWFSYPYEKAKKKPFRKDGTPMFYIKEGFPTETSPKVVKDTISNMFAACTVCGKEVHLAPEDVTRNIRHLMSDSYLCPRCFNRMTCEICDDDEEDDYDFDGEDEEGDENADDDLDYEENMKSSDISTSFIDAESDDDTFANQLAVAAEAESERRFCGVSHAEYEKARHEIMDELKKLIYGNPNPRLEHIVDLQEACKGKI